MTLVLTNTNTDALMKISEGNLDVLEELAVDWKKSLSENGKRSTEQVQAAIRS